MILGLFETHINVSNLERAIAFYRDVLGLELGSLEQDRRVAFFWLGQRGEAMLGVWEKPQADIQPQHFAFRSSVELVRHHAQHYLRSRNLPAHNFLNDGTDEPMVFGWMPAIAIYFRDPDGHSLEFIAMLPGAPKPEVGVVNWATWQQINKTA